MDGKASKQDHIETPAQASSVMTTSLVVKDGTVGFDTQLDAKTRNEKEELV